MALLICLIGVIAHSAIADRAISDHRAAVDLDQHQLSGRVAGEPLQQRHAADRGRAQRRERHPELRIDQRFARSGRDHCELRARHEHRKRLGRGAEPPQARRGAAAARGDAAGHPGRGSLERGAADHHAALDRRQPRRSRARRLHDAQHRGRVAPHSRRRPRHALFDRTLAAGLDRSRPSWSATTSPPTTSPRRSPRRTRRSPPARSAPSPRAPASRFPRWCWSRASSRRRKSSARSCCAPTPTARPCGCATSRASRSAA